MSGYDQEGEGFNEGSSYYRGPRKDTSRASQGGLPSYPPSFYQYLQDDGGFPSASDNVAKGDQYTIELGQDTLRTSRFPFQNTFERPPQQIHQQIHQHVHHGDNVVGHSNDVSGRYESHRPTIAPHEDHYLSGPPGASTDHQLLPSGRHTNTNSPRERASYAPTPLESSRTNYNLPVVEQDPARAGTQKGKKSVHARDEEDPQSCRPQQGKRGRRNEQGRPSSVKPSRFASQDVKEYRAYFIILGWLMNRGNSSQALEKDDLEELAWMTELSHRDLVARLQGEVDFAMSVPRHLLEVEPNLRVTYSPYYQSDEAYASTYSKYRPETIEMIVQYFKSKWDGGCGTDKVPNASDKYPCFECGVLFIKKLDWKKHLQDHFPHLTYLCSMEKSKAPHGPCNSIHHRHFNWTHLRTVHGISVKEKRQEIMGASLLPLAPFSGHCGYCGDPHTDLDAFYDHIFDHLEADSSRNDWVREWPVSAPTSTAAPTSPTASSLVDLPHPDDASASQSNSVPTRTSITSASQQPKWARNLRKGKRPAPIVPSSFSGSGQEPRGVRPHSAPSAGFDEFGPPPTSQEIHTNLIAMGDWTPDV